ncbi:hypothetical protein Ancab_039739 [Ancistrocladus abbreviatus]
MVNVQDGHKNVEVFRNCISQIPADLIRPIFITCKPDLDLLAVPDLVFALTFGQASGLSSEETVKLIDMIKSSGGKGFSSFPKSSILVSLPSPTPTLPSKALVRDMYLVFICSPQVVYSNEGKSGEIMICRWSNLKPLNRSRCNLCSVSVGKLRYNCFFFLVAQIKIYLLMCILFPTLYVLI